MIVKGFVFVRLFVHLFLPPLTLQEAIETTKIHSVAGLVGTNSGIVTTRPFRSTYYTISDIALFGRNKKNLRY